MEIEDFFTFQDILIRAIEQFNSDYYNENLSNENESPLIKLKGNPELYKIRIGKKKTGLPNYDYPPLIPDKKIKNSNFPVISILYDTLHIDQRNSNIGLNNEKEVCNILGSENIFENIGGGGLKDKLLINEKKGNRDNNFNSTIDGKFDFGLKRSKKCCDRCEIF